MSGKPVSKVGAPQLGIPAMGMKPGDMIRSAIFGDLQHAGLKSIYSRVYTEWIDAHTDNGLPSRSIIGPSWLGRLVSSSLLLQVEGDDLRHRICGELFLNRNGRFDPTGLLLSDMAQTRPIARLLQPNYQRVVRDAVPAMIGLRYLNVSEHVRDCELLVLPFGPLPDGGPDVAFVLSIYHFLPAAPAAVEGL